MPQFLYRTTPVRVEMLAAGPTPEEAGTIGDHFRYLQRLLAAKVLLMAGRTTNDDESTFGVVVFEAADEARAAEVMNNDPAVKGGVMKAELFPYRVALWSAHGPGSP